MTSEFDLQWPNPCFRPTCPHCGATGTDRVRMLNLGRPFPVQDDAGRITLFAYYSCAPCDVRRFEPVESLS
jgi:hypothetical protein